MHPGVVKLKMSRSATMTATMMSTLVATVFMMLLMMCATVKSNEQDEVDSYQASIDTNLTHVNEEETEHISYEEILAEINEELFDYTSTDTSFVDYKELENALADENLAGYNEELFDYTSTDASFVDYKEFEDEQHALADENLAGYTKVESQDKSLTDSQTLVESQDTIKDGSLTDSLTQVESQDESLTDILTQVESQDTVKDESLTDSLTQVESQDKSLTDSLTQVESRDTVKDESLTDSLTEVESRDTVKDESLTDSLTQVALQDKSLTDSLTQVESQDTIKDESLTQVESQDTIKDESLTDSLTQVESQDTIKDESLTQVESQDTIKDESLTDSLTQVESQDDSLTDSPSNFVRVVNYPAILAQDSKVVVEYHCEENSIVVVDLTVMLIDVDTYFTVYSKAWTCYGQGLEGKSLVKSIRLRLPDSLAYRPDYFLKSDAVWQVSWCKLRAWLIDEATWQKNTSVDLQKNCRSWDIHKMTVLPPYSRPYKKADCTIWIWPYVQTLHALSDSQTCAVEKEYVTLLDYPVAFSGHYYGIIKQLSPFTNLKLEGDRLHRRSFPQFSVELWVYILDYCPMHHLSPVKACGLFIHMNSEGLYHTPAIFINTEGNVQIDVKGSNGFIGMKSVETVPKNKWTRILFSFFERQWFLYINHGPELKDGFWTTYTYSENIYMDDTDGLMSLGGVDWSLGSFVGYMGRVVYYRRRTMTPFDLSVPDKSHPMFELHLARRQEKCDNFLSWMDSAVDVFQNYRRYIILQKGDTCQNEPLNFFMQFLSIPEDVTTCPLINPYNLSQHRHVSRLLRKSVLSHSLSNNFLNGDSEAYSRNYMNASQLDLEEVAVDLLEKAKIIVNEKGFRESRRVVHLLKQAACLGNDDAMFTLAVMLNNGVGCAPDEIQSLAFFMLGILNRHLLSVMALGHRHVMGIDGAPVDMDVAYMYYKQVADMTRAQRELHKESGIATESIRLTDEARIQSQTSEAGDLFLWLKHQAEKGVASAQSQLGTMLYHGSQGIKRNLQSAINIFKDGAQMGNSDAMFNYGIMQYRGMGAEANKTEGKRMLLKAAELNNPNAVSALGWVALQVDKNYTHAVEMFHLAKQLGHMDSGFYLAFMHHFGLVPNETYNLDKAFEEYTWSAKKGQIDAGIMMSFLLSRGTTRYKRHEVQALEWARFIAEKNANLAAPLRDALNAFRDGNHDLALYLYLMLADTGIEVASFNLAYLCEHSKNDVKSFISKECEWRHYNLSTQREPHFVDAYAFIKMGDYYWYGCEGQRNMHLAASHYSQAALKGNPQALFNLAFMVEEGAEISPVVWWMLHLSPQTYTNKATLLLELYSRCQESAENESFIPCYLAWIRVWSLDVWNNNLIYMKITSFLTMFLAVATTTYLLYKYFRQRRVDKHEEEERKAEEEIRAEEGRDAEEGIDEEEEIEAEKELEVDGKGDEGRDVDEKGEPEEERQSENEDDNFEEWQAI